MQGARRGVVDDAELRRHMQCAPRCIPPRQLHRTQIADDQCIHADIVHKGQVVRHPRKVFATRQDIARDIQLLSGRVGAPHRIGQAVGIKVGARGAHPEFARRNIHRVRAEAQGGGQPFAVPGRGQNFRTNDRHG